MNNYPSNTSFPMFPLVNKVTYVVQEIVGELTVPLFETGNYLVALAKITELRKKYKYIYKFKLTEKS